MERKFSKVLKDLRTEQNLSYEKLSKLTGISASTLYYWEIGKQDIKSDYLIKLTKFFKVSTDYFLGLED